MFGDFIFEQRYLDHNYVVIADGLMACFADRLETGDRFDREIYGLVMVDLITDPAMSLPDRLMWSLMSFGIVIDVVTAAMICHFLQIPAEYNSNWYGHYENLRPTEV